MKLSDLHPRPLAETHYTDLYPKAFEAFRKKYSALAKTGQGDDLYVQFSNFADNLMDRTAHQSPDHSDPVGVYGYPLSYVLKYPADVWYGKGMRYLRVLRSTAKKSLVLPYSVNTEDHARRVLVKMGMTYPQADDALWSAKTHYKSRVTGPNKIARMFFQAVQMDMSSGDVSSHRLRTGAEQTALFLRAGYDAIEDIETKGKRATINDREPEQIIFLTRAAFRVEEVFNLRGGTPNSKMPGETHVDGHMEIIERPFAQAIAAVMGDVLVSGRLTSNLGGWSYYWTKSGRRIEIKTTVPDGYYNNLRLGEKPHRRFKSDDGYVTYVKVQSEIGTFSDSYASSVKFAAIVKEFKAAWKGFITSPQDTGWTPENAETYQEKEKNKRMAVISAKLEKERQERIAQVPQFIEDARWAAERYRLPFTPMTPQDGNEALIDALDEVGVRATDEKIKAVRERLPRTAEFKGLSGLEIAFDQSVAIWRAAREEFGDGGRAHLDMMFGTVFGRMRELANPAMAA